MATIPGGPLGIGLLLAPANRCPYLPGRLERSLLIDPRLPLDGEGLGRLLDLGFRRSGAEVYRPLCSGCRACIAVRIPVADFVPDRSQRRCWERGQRLVRLYRRPDAFDPEHYRLYQRYQQARHPGSAMASASASSYLAFFANPWGEARFWELRIGARLLAIAAVDLVPRGISAVYTFFDPDLAHLSPGKLAILWLINEARRQGLSSSTWGSGSGIAAP